MSRYKPYPKYKESGVEWLGEVPEHWEVRKLSAYGSFIAGSGFPHEYQGLTSGDYPFFKVSDTNIPGNETYLIKSENYITKKIARTLNVTIAPKNGIMFPKVGAALLGNKRRILAQESVTDNNTMVYVVRNGVTKYWYYWLSILDFGKISNPGPVPSVNESQLRLFPSISPPLSEQTTIANFLDRETAKIDTLIGKQGRLIELLQEKRQALISHAVTKGLDPNVKMKESGVAWLGKVPEHWEVKKLKFNLHLRTEKVKIKEQKVIALENIESSTGKYIPTESTYKGEDVACYRDDVLFGKLRPYLAKVYRCDEDAIAFGDLLAYQPLASYKSSYAFYALISETFIKIVDSSTYGAKMPRASAEFINEMPLTTPPTDEQQQIADYLDTQTAKIDILIKKAKQAIKLLKERREALISAAVTGKIDVREAAV